MNIISKTLIYITFLCLSLTVNSEEANVVTISAKAVQVQTLEEILGDLEPFEFRNFKHPKMDRAIADFILVSKALHLGGYPHKFSYVESPNYARSLFNVRTGKSALMNQSVWLQDVSAKDVYISDVVIEDGWFQKGVYTLPERADVLAVDSVEALMQFKTITSSNWVKDWQAINSLGLKPFNVSMDSQMFKMLETGRVDYLFLYFSTEEDLSSQIPGYKVVPVQNMKLKLNGTRHFTVSKKHKDAKAIFLALKKGLKILKAEGAIEKAMIDSGFINPRVKNWPVLNP